VVRRLPTALRWLGPLLLVLGAAVLSVPALAQAELVVISRDLEQGEIGGVRVRVRGDRPTAPPRITVDPPGGLNITFQGQGQQVNIVNGRVSRAYEYTYGVEALKQGTYTIGPAEVEIGTRKILTGTGTIRVEPRLAGESEDLQARAGFDVDEAYVGQVVLYRRSLRSETRILRDAWTDPPLDGLVPPRDGEPTYSEYPVQDGTDVTFIKEEYHPKIVTEPGVREVPSAVARVTIAAETGGRRSPFARGPTKLRVLPVPASELVVKELPPPPPGFSGLVGEFELASRVDRTQAAVGASINQTVVIRGDGTLERFELPRPQGLDSVRIYDGTPATAARVDGDGYKSEGRFERVLVPTEAGTLQVPPLQVITFSPARGEYVTHELTVPPLTIRPGKDGDKVFESFVEDGTVDTDLVMVEEPYEGVREVRSSGWARAMWLGDLMPWTLGLAFSPLVVLGAIEGVRTTRTLAQKLVVARARPRTRDVTPKQRLSRLPSDPQARLAEVDAALRHALARATDRSIEDLDREQALAELPDALADKVRETTRALDRARFGGTSADPVALESQVKALVSELEAR